MSNELKYTITPELLTNYLINYSSEYHKVSILEMCSYFTQRIEYFQELSETSSEYDEKWDDLSIEIDSKFLETQMVYVPSNSTVSNQIRRLISQYLMKPLPCGISIWSSVSYQKALAIENTRQVFYAKRLLDESSISLLRDAIEVFPYAEPSKTKSIIDNLNMLTPYYNRREFSSDKLGVIKYPSTYYKNLEVIYKAFRAVKDDERMKMITPKERKLSQLDYNKTQFKTVNQISFEYCEYDETKKLKIKKLKNGKETRIVNPVVPKNKLCKWN